MLYFHLKKVKYSLNNLEIAIYPTSTSIKNALSIAKKRGFDLILLGWVDKIVYGKLTGTEIILKIRLIEIKSKKTLWYERDIKKTKAHDKSYPIESKLSEPAPSIEYSIRALAKNMVSSRFESKRIKDFFKLWEKKK